MSDHQVGNQDNIPERFLKRKQSQNEDKLSEDCSAPKNKNKLHGYLTVLGGFAMMLFGG